MSTKLFSNSLKIIASLSTLTSMMMHCLYTKTIDNSLLHTLQWSLWMVAISLIGLHSQAVLSHQTLPDTSSFRFSRESKWCILLAYSMETWKPRTWWLNNRIFQIQQELGPNHGSQSNNKPWTVLSSRLLSMLSYNQISKHCLSDWSVLRKLKT